MMPYGARPLVRHRNRRRRHEQATAAMAADPEPIRGCLTEIPPRRHRGRRAGNRGRRRDLPLRLAQHGPADGAAGTLRLLRRCRARRRQSPTACAALHLICLAAGLGPGDEVIVPSRSPSSPPSTVRYVERNPYSPTSPGSTALALGRRRRRGHRRRHPRDPQHVLRRPRGRDHGARGPGRRAAADPARGRRTEPAAASTAARWTLGLAGAYSFFANKNASRSVRAGWSPPATRKS